FLAGQRLLSRRGNQLALSETATGFSRQLAINPNHGILAAAVTPDGALLAIGGEGRQPNMDGKISLWDLATDMPRGTFTSKTKLGAGQTGAVLSLAFSP